MQLAKAVKARLSARPSRLSLILGFIFVGIICLGYLVGLVYIMSPSKACPSEQIKGKSNQEIADVLGYPLLMLSRLPPDVPNEPQVIALTDFPDPRCFLRVRYVSAAQQKPFVEIMVVVSPDQLEDVRENWKCLDDPTVNFVTSCNKTIMYEGKILNVWLGTQYSLAETQALTALVEISA